MDRPRKLVRFKDEGGVEEDECKEEDCPPFLVRLVLLSVDDNGYLGNEDTNASHHWVTSSMPLRPPPLPPLLPATLRPPPSILTTTKGTSLPPPMQQWGGCGGRRMRGGAGLQQGEEDGGTSVVPWAWMRGWRWHWRNKRQQGAAQQGVARCAVAQ